MQGEDVMADLLSFDEVRALDAERARGAAHAHLLDEARDIQAQQRVPILARLGDWLIALGSYLKRRHEKAMAADAPFIDWERIEGKTWLRCHRSTS